MAEFRVEKRLLGRLALVTDKFPTIAQLVERPTVVEFNAAIGRSLVRIRVVGSFFITVSDGNFRFNSADGINESKIARKSGAFSSD